MVQADIPNLETDERTKYKKQTRHKLTRVALFTINQVIVQRLPPKENL